MRRINRTVYIVNDGFYIHCEGDAFVFEKDGIEKTRIPALSIEQIVIFGNTTISSYFVGYCSEHGINVSYVSNYGKYYGSFRGGSNGNVLLRQKQYLNKGTEKELGLAKNFVLGKAINSRHTILRSAKNVKDDEREK